MKKVLIIDDDEDMGHLLKLRCESSNKAKAEYCRSAIEGYTKIKEGSYDIAFVDLSMPVVDGIWLVDSLKRQHVKTAMHLYSASKPDEVCDIIGRRIDVLARGIISKLNINDEIERLLSDNSDGAEGSGENQNTA